MKPTIEMGWGVVSSAAHCSSHPVELNFTMEDVLACIHYDSTCSHGKASTNTLCNQICETGSDAVLVLKDGRFIKAWESSDTTGHG